MEKQEMKTIQQIKDETAIGHGWKNYDDIIYAFRNGIISDYSFDDFFEDVVKLYNQQERKIVPYQVCPICNGSGIVTLYPPMGIVQQTCDVCNGAKIIPMHPFFSKIFKHLNKL